VHGCSISRSLCCHRTHNWSKTFNLHHIAQDKKQNGIPTPRSQRHHHFPVSDVSIPFQAFQGVAHRFSHSLVATSGRKHFFIFYFNILDETTSA
jgi:hypothetical protein